MYYVGIDIAKSFHVVSVIDDSETKVINKPFKINNDLKGFEKLLTILDSVTLDKDDFIIGIEATGIYGENLLEFLKSKGYSVKLLNPIQTSRYTFWPSFDKQIAAESPPAPEPIIIVSNSILFILI